jgi:hypothetical protein
MHKRGRASTRHMKGKQVAVTLYLPPRKYWLLKSISENTGMSMQHLLRGALDQVLVSEYRSSSSSLPVSPRAAPDR